MIQGAVSSEWWSRQALGFTNKFKDEMRMGMLKGENLAQMKNRIYRELIDFTQPVTKPLMKTAQRNAEALVRTSTLTVMREAHLDVFEANADVIEGVQWLSTLDSRTTPQCRTLDGLEWTLPDYQPKGHSTPFPGASAHWNCRSVVIPVTKSWEDLAKEAGGDTELAKQLDDIPEGQRASIGGPVEAGMTYQEWFGEQTKEKQEETKTALSLEGMQRELGLLPFHVDPEEFAEWFNKPAKQPIVDDFIVDNLPNFVQELLNTNATSMRIGHDYFEIPSHKKRNIPPEKFAQLLSKIKDSPEAFDRGHRHIGFIVEDKDPWMAVLKSTHDKLEAFLVSLRRIEKRKLIKLQEGTKRVYKK